MRNRNTLTALFAASLAMSVSGYGPPIASGIAARRKPKNKYNLSPEEIEMMSGLTSKEKDKFLKSRGYK